jgi:predicted glycosyltransferase involved in capsule biosynthesis
MVAYAAAAGKEHLAIVTPHCAHLDSMFTEWGTDLEKRRVMYTAIFDAMKKHDNRFLCFQQLLNVLIISCFCDGLTST